MPVMRLWMVIFASALAASTALTPARADPADDLKQLGLRVRQDIASTAIQFAGAPDQGEIRAIGPCVRPSAAERAVLRKRVAPEVVDDALGGIAFGCVEPSGIVVDVAFDTFDKKTGAVVSGVWNVVRASAPTADAKLTMLHHYEGVSIQNFMEWSNEVIVATQVLVDIDRDGTLDALIVSDQHEGGAQHHDTTLSWWRSSDGRTVKLGTYDGAWLATTPVGAPFVIGAQATRPGAAGLRYRCLSASGLTLCPDVVAARRTERRLEIASWFVDGHGYPPFELPLPDRELLGALLDELGIAGAERAALIARMQPTKPAMRVAREIERLLAPKPIMKYGEVVEGQPPAADPRPARIAALLGEARCTAAPRAVMSDVAAWIRGNDAAVLVAHGDCAKGARCTFSRHSAPRLVDSCVQGADGYVLARWDYSDSTKAEVLRRTVLFKLAPALTPVATSTLRAPISVCSACGPMESGNQIDVDFHRRDAKLIAIVSDENYSAEASSTTAISVLVDGVVAAAPPADAVWARLREPEGVARDVVETATAGGTRYWQFDGAHWQPLVDVAYDPAVELPASASPAARYLFGEVRRAQARDRLSQFSAADWASQPPARAATRADLVRLGADAATLARVDAQATAATNSSP